MSFCAIFIAVLLERFFDYSHLRNWRWFASYQKFIMQKFFGQSPAVVFAMTLAPFVIGLLLVEYLFSDALFGFLYLFLSTVIILYCLGPRNLWADIFACLIDIDNNDAKALADKLKVSFNVVPSSGADKLHRELLASIFIQANRRVFAAIVWYGLLGLPGVVVYRLLTIMVGDGSKEHLDPVVAGLAHKAEGYMDWVAVRIFTLLFALGGNFSRVFAVWGNYVARGFEANDTMLVECGLSALNATTGALPTDGSAEKEQSALLDRSFAIMLVIVAILVFWIP